MWFKILVVKETIQDGPPIEPHQNSSCRIWLTIVFENIIFFPNQGLNMCVKNKE